MTDLANLDEGIVLGLCGMLLGALGIIGGVSVAITKVMSGHYRRTQLDEMEATLKMEMIQRGMSAQEITQVLSASMAANKSPWTELLDRFPAVRGPMAFGKPAEQIERPLASPR